MLALSCFLLPCLPARGQDAELDGIDGIIDLLIEVDDADLHAELLDGIQAGLKGRKNVRMPKRWPAAFADLSKSKKAIVRERALQLGLIFGDPRALETLRKVLTDRNATTDSRVRALQALTDARAADLPKTLYALLGEPKLRRHAIRALAAFDATETPKRILAAYATLSGPEKQDAVATLCSRLPYALSLLAAVEKKTIPGRDLTALHARQLKNLNNKKVSRLLAKLWGSVRKTSAERKARIAATKKFLTPQFLAKADLRRGRYFFSEVCQKCHRLFDAGKTIGPELTGSNRANVDYILENILDPSAAIGKDYQLSTLVAIDGRIVAGIVKERTAERVSVQTETELVTIPPEDVAKIEESTTSMMPEGLIDKMSREDIRDLIAYLASPRQVQLPDAKVSVPGKDTDTDTDTDSDSDTEADSDTATDPDAATD